MRKKSGNKAASPVAAAAPGGERKPKRQRLLAIVIALLLVLGALVAYVATTKAPSSASVGSAMPPVAVDPEKTGKTASYVGAKVCKTCHESEFKAWSGSHHDLAMQEAAAATVLGNFADARFRHQGVESTLLQARRQVHGPHRRPRRQARRLRNRLHLRRLPAAAIPDRFPRRALPGAVDRLGCAGEGSGRPALVPSAARREDRPQGSAALDRPLPELGAAMCRMPFDRPEEGL